jgi:hypothetical protein
MMVPHQMLQPQPTRQKSTVKSCPTPTMMFKQNVPRRSSGRSSAENLGRPKHRQNAPLKIVPANCVRVTQLFNCVSINIAPKPGMTQFKTRQIHARETGRTGIAVWIMEFASSSEGSKRLFIGCEQKQKHFFMGQHWIFPISISSAEERNCEKTTNLLRKEIKYF